jgi:HK97 family phage prohead protease
VIGTIEHLKEDGRGLQVIGRLHDDAFGRLLGQELEQGRLGGLSFGYRVEASRRSGTHRDIDALELLEVSLVRHPMQPLARVHKLAA